MMEQTMMYSRRLQKIQDSADDSVYWSEQTTACFGRKVAKVFSLSIL